MGDGKEERIGIHRMANPATGEELVNTIRTEIANDGVLMEIGAAVDPTIKTSIYLRGAEAARREREIEDAKRNVNRSAGKRRGDYAVPKPTGDMVLADRYTMIPCPDCDGWGEMEDDAGRMVRCPRCLGDRMVESGY